MDMTPCVGDPGMALMDLSLAMVARVSTLASMDPVLGIGVPGLASMERDVGVGDPSIGTGVSNLVLMGLNPGLILLGLTSQAWTWHQCPEFGFNEPGHGGQVPRYGLDGPGCISRVSSSASINLGMDDKDL